MNPKCKIKIKITQKGITEKESSNTLFALFNFLLKKEPVSANLIEQIPKKDDNKV